MRCTLVAVGRAKPGPERELYERHARTLRPPLHLIEVEERRKLPDAERREREAALLLGALPAGATAVLLDEHGAMSDSTGLAKRLAAWRDAGIGELVFLIGGAAGHGAAIRARADATLSLGPMTWPHLLVRTLLAEQLYRGFSILAGHPYHRT